MKIKIKKLIELVDDDFHGETFRLIHYELKISPKKKDKDALLKFKELREDFHFEEYFDKKGKLRILF